MVKKKFIGFRLSNLVKLCFYFKCLKILVFEDERKKEDTKNKIFKLTNKSNLIFFFFVLKPCRHKVLFLFSDWINY